MADTIYLVQDTITKVCNKACQYQNLVKNETNACDEAIAQSVCSAIWHIAVLVAVALLVYYIVKRLFDGVNRKKETKKELQKEALEYIKERVRVGESVEDDAYIKKSEQYAKQ